MYRQHLSLKQTLSLHYGFFRRGLTDSTRWRSTLRTISNNPVVRANVGKSVFIQTVLLGSSIVFNWLLLPLLFGRGSNADSEKIRKASLFYEVLWLYPLLAVSFYLGGFFTSNIEKAHAHYASDRRNNFSPTSSSSIIDNGLGMTARISSQIYRVLIIIQCTLITTLLTYIPIIGFPLSVIFMSCTNSFYCFDPHWVSRGTSVGERITILESHYAYFTGFGLPITLVSCLHPSNFINLSLFSALFPIALLMASVAEPIPLDITTLDAAYSSSRPSTEFSSSTSSSSSSSPSLSSHSSVPPHPNVPISLPVLRIAYHINHFIVSNLLRTSSSSSYYASGKQKKSANPPPPPPPSQPLPPHQYSQYYHQYPSSNNVTSSQYNSPPRYSQPSYSSSQSFTRRQAPTHSPTKRD